MIERRTVLKSLALAAVSGTFARAGESTDKRPPVKHPVRLGGPLFVSETDPEAWARKAKELRYRAVYAPNVPLDDAERIRAVVEAVRHNDLVIAEVGRWVNLLDADPVKRAANLQTVTDGLALAEALGARCCVDIAGSFHPTSWFGPDPRNVSEEFFDLTVENVRKIVDAVKPKRAKFALEMMGWALPDTPDAYLRLLKAVDREGFGVHVDICNLVNTPDKFWNNTRVIEETFDKLGPKIVSAHAKDLTWPVEPNVHFRECAIGDGSIDYGTYLKRLATLEQDVPLMIEHMKDAEEYAKCRDRLFMLGAKNGVKFEWV